MEKIKCSCVVVAGGKGVRMGLKEKKQYIKVDNRCILFYTLNAVSKSEYIDKIILVVGEEDIDFAKSIVLEYGLSKVAKIVSGGKTRSESVKNGLKHIGECDIVAIHDGVRPLVSKNCIDECIENALSYGASTLGVVPKETVKVSHSGYVEKTIDRDSLVLIQTPQCFKKEIIIKAYENFNPDFTDDCMQVEKEGIKIHITKGEYENIKITTKSDLVLFEALKKNFEKNEVCEKCSE